MLMGCDTSVVIGCVMVCWLCMSRGIQSMDNTTLRSLDDFFQECAENSLPKRAKTGVLYNASLPSNFSGIEVSIVRLRRGSFWSKGANYSGFHMPPRIFTEPSFTRLDLVFSNLGNESSKYYNVPNYTLITPVVGFNAYGVRDSGGQIGNLSASVTKLNLTLLGGPILVQFPEISLGGNESAKCVTFFLNGTTEMIDMSVQDICAVHDQGHFSIAIRAPPRVHSEPRKKERTKLWKWWVFGFAIGVFGLLLFGFIIFIIIRIYKMRKIRKMEREAERNEGLDTKNVGHSRMPSATTMRTPPAIENDDLP